MTTKAEADGTQTTIAYDLGGRTTSVAPSSGSTAAFTLDALGRVKTRAVGPSTDTYGYVGGTGTAYEVANSGGSGLTTDSGVDPAGRFAIRVGAAAPLGVLFDVHGDVAGLESAAGAVTDAYRYDAYGGTIAASGATANSWRYQGRADVSPNGSPLYDMGARLYAPSVGAFTQADSVLGAAQDPLSMNRFGYAEANPSTLVDPDGHASVYEDTDCGPNGIYCGGTTRADSHTKSDAAVHRASVRTAVRRYVAHVSFRRAAAAKVDKVERGRPRPGRPGGSPGPAD